MCELPDGGTRATSSTETNYDAAAIIEYNAQTLRFENIIGTISIKQNVYICVSNSNYLFRGHRFVDGIGVTEIVGNLHFVRFAARRVCLAHKRWIGDGLLQKGHHFVAWLKCAFLVIVTCEIIASVNAPMLLQDLFDAFASVFHDRQPCEHRPNAIFLTNVIRAGSTKLTISSLN